MDFQKLPDAPIPKINFNKLLPIDYFGMQLVVPSEVYGPMEDTDLSIKFLREWILKFKNSSKVKDVVNSHAPFRILEMGTGCGILSLYIVSRMLQEKIQIVHNAVDINPIAVQTAKFNAKKNNLDDHTNFYTGDLFDPLTQENQKKPYDFILFNPPYLASEPETINESNRQWIDLSWEGGTNGNEITLKFLENVSNFLTKHGEMFYISSTRVDQAPIEIKLKELNLKLVKQYEKKVFFETINLYHYRR